MTAHPIPDAALDGDIAILGRKGGGKTFTAKGLVERLLDLDRRVLVLDPLGVWAGLRTAADGEKPGYPVAVFGGDHGDLPLDTAAAVPMADVLARENVPAVLDLSNLSKTAQQSFLLAFLHELRRVNRDALTIVLEEADVFAPQNPLGDDSKLLHSEIDWIARRGRFRGFRLITVTQRPARLSKDVLTQCSTLIAHKLPAPQDQAAVKAWVDGNGDAVKAKEVLDTLARLDVGEAWVYAPEHDILRRARFPLIKTLDTSATPKAGEKRIEPKTLAQVDLAPIKAALDAASKEKAAPRTKEQKVTTPDPQALADAEHHGYQQGFAFASDAYEAFIQAVRRTLPRLTEIVEVMESETVAAWASIEEARGQNPLADPPAQVKRRASNGGSAPGSGDAGARKMAEVLDVNPRRWFTWTQVAMLAGYSESGGAFRRGKKWLIENGAVNEEGDRVSLIGAPGPTARPAATGDALVELWASRIDASGAAVLRLMWSDGRLKAGRSIGAEDVAARLSYQTSGGAWRRGIKALRNAGIIHSGGGQLSFAPQFLEIARG